MTALPLASRIACIVAGVLFASGWLLTVSGLYHGAFTYWLILLPLLSTAGFVMLALVSSRAITKTGMFTEGTAAQKAWLLASVGVVLAGPAGSLVHYAIHHTEQGWPAVLLLCGSALIALRYARGFHGLFIVL